MSAPGDALLSLDLPADQSAARHARTAIGEPLSALVSEDCAEVVTLLASELVTNAVLHAHSPVGLSLWADVDSVRVEVRDESPTPPRIRLYGALSTTGRGIRLLEHLSTRWGVVPHAGGKTVWFELDAHAEPPAACVFDVEVDGEGEGDEIEPW